MLRPLLTLALLLVALAPSASGQTDDRRRVVLDDGTVLVGTVADEGADPLVVVTDGGVEQRVPRVRVVEVTPLIDGRFYRLDPTRTRLVVSPTGRTLGRGRTRVGTLVYVVPNATVGLTDRLDLGGTLGITGGSDFLAVTPVIGAKLGLVDTGSFAAAIGTNVALPLATEGGVNGAFAVTPYAAVTVGSALRSVSASVTAFVGGDIGAGDVDAADGVLLALGGEVQVNNGLKLLADVGVPVGAGDSGAVVAPGVRLFGDQFAIDVFGFAFVGDGGVFGFAPVANFGYTF